VETVSRQISRMKADGIIKLIGIHHYTVPNLNRLAALAGQEPPVWQCQRKSAWAEDGCAVASADAHQTNASSDRRVPL
jgi:diketogulonate reductase-like aldo/keto reductase